MNFSQIIRFLHAFKRISIFGLENDAVKSSAKGKHSFMPVFAVPRQLWEKLLLETTLKRCKSLGK